VRRLEPVHEVRDAPLVVGVRKEDELVVDEVVVGNGRNRVVNKHSRLHSKQPLYTYICYEQSQ
jgi:hypothetical protein